jgi:hypothetical protein
MASLSALRAGIAARLATIPGLTVYASPPGQVNVPAAIVLPAADFVTFDATMGRGSDDFSFLARVLVADTVADVGQDSLDAYLAGSGAHSVKAAIEGDGTLGGIASYAVVTSARAYGDYEYAGLSYLGVEFAVEVTA